MNASLVIAAFALLFAPVQEPKVKIVTAPAVGVAKYKYLMTTSLNGSDVEVSSDVTWTTKSVEGGLVKSVITWPNMKISVGGGEPQVPVTDTTVDFIPATGEAKGIHGGIEGTDNARGTLLFIFVPPKAEIGSGESYKVDFAANKEGDIPAHTTETTFVGKADYKGKPALKFTQHYSEAAKDSMVGDTTFLVKEDGTILSTVSKFKNLPLPQFGTIIDGTSKLDLAE